MSGQFSPFSRFGILGGSFDPIHNGHLAAAIEAIHELSLERVFLVPTGKPPHKPESGMSASRHRLAMCDLASANYPKIAVSDIELNREGYIYTIDTLKQIRSECSPNAEIFLLLGADAISQMGMWKDSDKVQKLATPVGLTRPGFDLPEPYKQIIMPGLDISSTDIRQRAANGKPISHLVPWAVSEYIQKYNLYARTQNGTMTIDEITLKIQQIQSSKRFTHTQGVMMVAVKLAQTFGFSEEKARLAALLHDCAKVGPGLAHCERGAIMANEQFGINDTEILDAIRYHSTGRAGMTTLDKIIIVADMTEPGRDYKGVEVIREASSHDLNLAVKLSLESKIRFMKRKEEPVSPLTFEALEELKL